jgi:succinate dehydrogenase / fumarate reductase iron-sulfur subunit
MNLTLHIWRQAGPERGRSWRPIKPKDIEHDMSFLEMLDVLNEQLIEEDKDPIAFDTTAARASAACGS